MKSFSFLFLLSIVAARPNTTPYIQRLRTEDPFPLFEDINAFERKVEMKTHTSTPRTLTPQNCDSLPGFWTGGFGNTCGSSPIGDSYLFNWTIPASQGAWTATMQSGGGWNTGKSQNSPDNTSTIMSLDTGLTLHGNISSTSAYGQCSCILWDNGSWWMKALQPSTITDVHIIAMNHLDVGYDGIPKLGLINNILNIYFQTYFPRAVSVAAELRGHDGPERLIYTTHGWLVHLYLHCPENFTLSGITLQCPSQEDIDAFKGAVAQGDIVWHAATFNVEYENAFNEEMIDVQFQLSRDLADELGIPRPSTVSLRDVPGTTRGLVPILVRNNITAISIGVNGGSPAPAMPNPGIWRDPASATEVLYMQTGQDQGYPNNPGPDPVNCGGMCKSSCVTFEGLNHALCWAFRTDNSGPPMNADEVFNQWAIAQWQFPGANVYASTYDNFLTQLNTVRASLPVTTAEAGDTWVTSTTADANKMTFYRESARAYAECLANGQCDIHDPRVLGFTRLLAKIPEHTYGLPGMNDDTNFKNVDFHAAIAAGEQAYVDCYNAYTEQRDIAQREGMRYLADHPLAAAINARMAAIVPLVPDVSSLQPVAPSSWATPMTFNTNGGSVTIGFDGTTGALTKANLAGVDWADSNHPLAQFVYKTYNDTDLNEQQTCCYGEGKRQAITNMQRTITNPTMTGMWTDMTSRTVVVSMSMPDLQHSYYGAPSDLYISLKVNDDATVSFDFQMFNKTATRLPEAHFLHFLPTPIAGDYLWMMDKIGTWINPLDVVENGSLHQHGIRNGVRYMSSGSPNKYFDITSLDAFTVNPATDANPASMFPQPLTPLIGPVIGFDFQLMQNAFNTNTPLFTWDTDYRWRFVISAKQV